MPEENWAAHGGIQACDLCHSRKVKCDRKDPCANCIVAKADCLRNRLKRTPRPKVKTDEKIQALVQRLSTLENSVRTTQHVPNIAIQDIHGSPPDAVMSSDRPMKRKRTESLVNSTSPTTVPEVDTTQQSATEARSLISKELTTNGFLTGHQRSVLETAMNFVDHLSHAPVPPITDRSTFNKNMYSSVDLSKGEILKVILGTDAQTNIIDIVGLDHIPSKAVERIGLMLMEGTADERTLLLCKIIIHYKAAVVLYARSLQGPTSAEVQKHIRQLEYDHLSAALTALDSISFLTPPSLLLAQALLTGGVMMQIIGNPASCWELTAHASRTIVALGYHTIDRTEPKDDLEEEINAVVAWCSQYDSCMSLLLLRPRSLPPLKVKELSLLTLDHANPMTIFDIMAMEMIPVHDRILKLSLEANAKRHAVALKDEVGRLRQTMADILGRMEEKRPTILIDNNRDILLHWKCLEFKYFSTLASVHRLSPTVTTNPAEREACLQSARKALECVKLIEDIGKSLGHFIEGYDPYLAWTMLSYPLCPFFVVFCNVVGTSNVQDFQLLEDVTEGISTLVTENKFVNRLHRLCAMLLGLCKPLVQNPGPNASMYPTSVDTSDTESMLLPSNSGPDLLNVPGANGDVDGFLTSSWNDDMMWQLFQSQPTLDWFNADILDPTGDITLPK